MRSLIVTGITFGVFMTEALIHYNMGRAGPDGQVRFELPPPRELAKIAMVTAAFSVASGAAVGMVERRLGGR